MIKITSFDKFNIPFLKSDFDRRFPLFAKYEFDSSVKTNATENEDLIRKYNQYNQSITSYLYELDKRFDKETIKKIIVETIFKNPDEIMISIITSYLNSSEDVKSNELFVNFYNKTSNFGVDSIHYMQKNGIILDRKYKDIPILALDDKYDSIKSGEEIFKDELLDTVYDSLSPLEKRYVVSLIENNSYGLLDLLFSRFNFTTKSLIRTLIKKGIGIILINNEVISELEAYSLMLMFCYIIESENAYNLVNNITILVSNKRYDVLKKIIMDDKLENLSNITENELSSDDDTLINIIKNKVVTLQRIEEVA